MGPMEILIVVVIAAIPIAVIGLFVAAAIKILRK